MSGAPIVEAVRVVAVDGRHRAQIVIESAVARCSGARLVGQASNGVDGIAATRRFDPHVLVVDLESCALVDGDLLHELRVIAPDARVVAWHGKDGRAEALLDDGFVAAIVRDGCDAATLADALRRAHDAVDHGIATVS